ncbi:MAG: Maf family protein [Mariprofundaceae bacterium]|nr:Maf family protein [Mariprofundaceae bacterium]
MRILLASRSPRRLHLLQSAGFCVETAPQDLDESALEGELVQNLVLRLACAKAKAAGAYDVPVLGSDTLVAVDQHILGQPKDEADAFKMLRMLSGRRHQVLTGICVCYQGQSLQQHVSTWVTFRALSDDEISIYLQHNDYLDKAGAYAVQSGASRFITAVEGPMDNVIGLPVTEVQQLLEKVML